MEESRRSRKEKSGRLEWKRLSELSDSPGTTPGGMLINYLTILQLRSSFSEAVLLSVRERGCGRGGGERKGLWFEQWLQPWLVGRGVTLVRLKTRDCKRFALEIHETIRKTKEV